MNRFATKLFDCLPFGIVVMSCFVLYEACIRQHPVKMTLDSGIVIERDEYCIGDYYLLAIERPDGNGYTLKVKPRPGTHLFDGCTVIETTMRPLVMQTSRSSWEIWFGSEGLK